jgi:conserved oligomeric Golgi complex subunit 8
LKQLDFQILIGDFIFQANEVEDLVKVMLSQLHQNLRGNIQAKDCLENIAFLRRLDVYSETELRVTFLKSRDAWLASEVDRLSTNNAYSYLNNLLDLTRSHLYNVITQYRIVFTDSSSDPTYVSDRFSILI